MIYMTRQWTIIYRIADYFADFEDEFLSFKMVLARDAIEMMAYSLILYVFRPRRVWPEFYGVDIVTAKDSIFRSKQRPILQSVVNDKSVFDDFEDPKI